MTIRVPLTASTLCAPLIDGPRQPLRVAQMSRQAWQLADQNDVVVASLVSPTAVRLPNAFLLPGRTPTADASPSLWVGDGALDWDGTRLRVARWWRPARPRLVALRLRLRLETAVALRRGWRRLLGRGPGLTPYGDDVLCGALVALHATGHPVAAVWSADVVATPLEALTTATSAGLLRLAAEGWCIDEVAAYLTAVSRGSGLDAATAGLLAVGHSSGQGLIDGINRVVDADVCAAAA